MLWAIAQAVLWGYTGFRLCELFFFGRSQVAAGNGWGVSLVWASVIVAVLCAIFPTVRKLVVKVLAWVYKKILAAGEAIKAEANKTESK